MFMMQRYQNQFRFLGLIFSVGISHQIVGAPPVVVEDRSAQVVSSQRSDDRALSLSDRVAVLEQQMDSEKILGLLSRIEELTQELSELRGQLEVQNHQLDLLQNPRSTSVSTASVGRPMGPPPPPPGQEPQHHRGQQQDPRSNQQEGQGSMPPPSVGSPSPSQGSGAPTGALHNPEQLLQEQKLYMVAYERLKSKQYSESVNALDQYLQQYPAGRYSTHAHYWLGEVYFIQGQLDLAHEQFQWILQNAPQDQKSGDALLKVGFIQANQKKWKEAQKTLASVKDKYPGTIVARLADARLNQLKNEAD